MVRQVIVFIAGLLLVPSLAQAEYPTDRQIRDELNFARTKPHAYADELREYRSLFEGNIVYLPGDDIGIRTVEGVRAVDEAIAFMEKQQPLPPLADSAILAQAAHAHARDQGPQGSIGHTSSDGSRPGQRVVRHGGGRFVSETISYGRASARDVVRQLIVDDGVKSRGHRWIIFQEEMRFVGSACGYHATFGAMCVSDYSQWRDGEYVYARNDE